jgi:hypothetical protein
MSAQSDLDVNDQNHITWLAETKKPGCKQPGKWEDVL